jgi:DNA-binding transcriptional ArsR family regulator
MATSGAPAVVDVFGAVAHPIRRGIVTALASGDKPVAELAARLPVSRPAVSQHLAVLRSVGLVAEERAGRQHVYRLLPDPLKEIRGWLSSLELFWADRLDRLGDHLDRNP